jgi:hypothetical protein
MQIMEESIHEIILADHFNKADNIKAIGFFIQNIFKTLCFGIFGWIITRCMKSNRIQQMNPFNYFVSFLVLGIPLLICYMLLRWSKGLKDKQKKEKDAKDAQSQPKPAGK